MLNELIVNLSEIIQHCQDILYKDKLQLLNFGQRVLKFFYHLNFTILLTRKRKKDS